MKTHGIILLIILTFPILIPHSFADHSSKYEQNYVFDSFSMSDSKYNLSQEKIMRVLISGEIHEDEYQRGIKIILTIHNPDKEFEEIIVPITGSRTFATSWEVNNEFSPGEYKIIANYANHNSKELIFTVSENSNSNKDLQTNVEIKFPIWIQSIFEAFENKQISETEFNDAVKYLIVNNIIQFFQDREQKNLEDNEIIEWTKKIYIVVLDHQPTINDEIPSITTPSILTEINGKEVELLSIDRIAYLRNLDRIGNFTFPEGGTWYKDSGLARTGFFINYYHQNDNYFISMYEIVYR